MSGQTSKLTSVLYHQLPVSDGMGKLEIIFKNKFPFVYLMGGPWNGLKYLSHGVQDGCYGNWQIQGDIEGTSSSRGVRRGLGALRGAGVLSLMSSGPGLCGSLEDFHGSRKAFP